MVTATAFAAGVGPRSLLLGAAILCGQASIGWANDYVDADRDQQVRRHDKPVAAGEVTAATVGRAAAVALTLTVPLSLAIGWVSGAAHLVAVGSGWMYDVRLKQTVLSWVPYALSFGLLPVIIADRAKGPAANLPGLTQLHWIESTEPAAPEPLAKIVAALEARETAKSPEPWRASTKPVSWPARTPRRAGATCRPAATAT